jgi:Na+/melibiose symporter-like transporter
MGGMLASVMALSMLTCYGAAREPPRHAAAHATSFWQGLRAIPTNRPYLILLSAYLAYITALAVFGAVLAYFSTYILHRATSFLSLIFVVKYAAAVVSVPLWDATGKRFGKLTCYQGCMILITGTMSAFAFMGPQTPTWLVLGFIVAFGVVCSGVQIFALAMLADCALHGAARSEVSGSAGMYAGLFLAGEKLGFGVGALLCGAILAAAGLVATTNGSSQQPQSALAGIRWAISFAPALMTIIAFGTLCLYRPFERRMLAQHSTNPGSAAREVVA